MIFCGVAITKSFSPISKVVDGFSAIIEFSICVIISSARSITVFAPSTLSKSLNCLIKKLNLLFWFHLQSPQVCKTNQRL